MFGLLSTIVNVITSVLTFIEQTLAGFVQLLGNTPAYLNYLFVGIGYLPNPVLIFVSVTLSLFVILFIINR